MVIAEGAAGFEERLGSCKYCKLGTGTFACIWDMVFSICVIFDITLSRVSCNAGVANKGSGLFVWFQHAADLLSC